MLLTGATGFLGKVLLETLLRRREALGVQRVFALVRAADDASARARLEREVLASPCCAELGADAAAAVVAVRGDVALPGCGLDPADTKTVMHSVNRIIHCAASIDFDLPLTAAAQINTRGALEIAGLAERCATHGDFASLVLISTAYVAKASTARCRAAEVPVSLSRSAAEIYGEICNGGVDEGDLLRETGYPNTYTLTKALAEHLVTERAAALPLAIVRPSVISTSRRHPMPGWIDSHAAFAQIVMGAGSGQLRAVAATPTGRLDLVPCDDVARCAVDTAFGPAPAPGQPRIRHATAGWDQSCSIEACQRQIERFFHRHPIGGRPRVRYIGPLGSRFRIAEWIHHRVPLAAAELWARLARRHRQAEALRRRGERVREINRSFAYFTHHSFDFQSAVPLLDADFDPEDYLETVCAGIHRHLLRRDPRELSFAGREHTAPARGLREVLRLPRGELVLRAAAWGLSALLRRCAERVSFDLHSLRDARVATRPGSHWVFVASYRCALDYALLPYLFLLHPDLDIAPPAIGLDHAGARAPLLTRLARSCGALFLDGDPRQLEQRIAALLAAGRPLLCFVPERGGDGSQALPAIPSGLLERLQQSGHRFDVLPTAVSYDRIAAAIPRAREGGDTARDAAGPREILRGLRRLWRDATQLGRIHIAFGQPFPLDPHADPTTLADCATREIESALVTTTHHLRCFVKRHQLHDVDLAWLTKAIRERGGRVLRSRLRDTGASIAMETTLREQWQQLFLADAEHLEHLPARGLGGERGEEERGDRRPDGDGEDRDARLTRFLAALFDPAYAPRPEDRALTEGVGGGNH